MSESTKASITSVPLTFPRLWVLRVTGAHYQQLPQCHPGLTGQMDPNIPNEGDSTVRMELI